MKRVLVDQGSRAEIMYPDLYMGLNLKPKDLTGYNSPLLVSEVVEVELKYPCNCYSKGSN